MRALFEFTEIIEPAFNVIPSVNVTLSLVGQFTLYARKFELVTAAVAVLTEIVNELPVPSVSFKLVTTIVDMIAELPDGTVYKVVNTFAVGFLCPKILYVLAIC
jgi:hypothetical protein